MMFSKNTTDKITKKKNYLLVQSNFIATVLFICQEFFEQGMF